MRKLRTAVLAGVAVLCAAGAAVAATSNSHIMNVNLPDGSVARIEYKGDTAPNVRIEPTTRFEPIRLADPLDAAPFASVDRVFADMDRQMAAMMRAAQSLQQSSLDTGAKADLAAVSAAPASTVSYRFVSTSDGNRVCNRSWQWTAQGLGQPPKMTSATSGDCDTGGRAAAPKPSAPPSKNTPAAAPAATI